MKKINIILIFAFALLFLSSFNTVSANECQTHSCDAETDPVSCYTEWTECATFCEFVSDNDLSCSEAGSSGCGPVEICADEPPEEPEPMFGCTDPEASNYDWTATDDDGNCLYETASSCGNGIKESEEQCDGADYGGGSAPVCNALGYAGPENTNVACNGDCTYDTYECGRYTCVGYACSLVHEMGGNNCSVEDDCLLPYENFDYSLSTDTGDSSVAKSEVETYTENLIKVVLWSIITEPVTLSLSGVPEDVSYSIANNGCTPEPECESTITFYVNIDSPVGTHPITVMGSPGDDFPGDEETSFNLIITANDLALTCTPGFSEVEVGDPVTWAATISGGRPPYEYEWVGNNIPISPAPNTTPFSISYGTIGKKIATLQVTDADNQVATCLPNPLRVVITPIIKEI